MPFQSLNVLGSGYSIPFLFGIDSTLFEISSEHLTKNDTDLFIIFINSKEQNKIYRFKKGKLKNTKLRKQVQQLPVKLEKALKGKIDVIKKTIEKNNNNIYNIQNYENINLEIRDCFIEIFAQMFHNIKKYICLLDRNALFNGILFLEGIEKEDKDFYVNFLQTDVFDCFVQDFVREEYKYKHKYFVQKIKNYNENNKISKKFAKTYEANKQYIIKPDYLEINEKYINKNNFRIVENIQELYNISNNFNFEYFDIYLIPEKNEKSKKQEGNPFEIPKEKKLIIHSKNIDDAKKKEFEMLNSAKKLALKEEKKKKEIE